MQDWHYADAARVQHGPLDTTEMQARHAAGMLSPDTLVWQPGMAEWEPLSQHAEALGIHFPAPPAPAPVAADGSIVVAESEVVYAGLWRRLAASIIDGFATSILSYAILIPVMLVLGMNLELLAGEAEDTPPAVAITFFVLVYGILLVMPAVYFGAMQATRLQASLGKLAVGIKVTRGDGSRIGFWRGFLRHIVYLLLTILTCGIGSIVTAFMAAMTQRRQAPHDFCCDTLVVDRWAYSDAPHRQQQGLDTVTIVVLAIYGGLLVLSLLFLGIMAAAIGLGTSSH